MPLTRNKRKRKIRSIRKTRGRKIKRNYRKKRKLSRKNKKYKKSRRKKMKKRNRTGKGILGILSKCMRSKQTSHGDTCVEELTEKYLIEHNFSTNKLKKMGREVKADIKDWVEDFKAREGREPNNIEKKEIDHLYKKFIKLQKMWKEKLSPTRLDLHKFHNDLRKMNKEGLYIPIKGAESDVSELTPSLSPGNNSSI